MSEMNQGNFQGMGDLDRAKALRMEAALLEHKERVRSRLKQLIAISQDPEYDKYLAQMLKDLDSGKATPLQVEKEAERSYAQYRQRLSKGLVKRPQPQPVVCQPVQQTVQSVRPMQTAVQPNAQNTYTQPKVQTQKKDYEFKVGAHVFSLVGAVFVLIAFVIFGFNFMTGIWQGLCLYAAALVLVLLSELLLRRKSLAFSNVVTGIGIGGLYVANIINYLVLHTINGIVAMIVTLIIALGTIFISRKKDSTVIRIISLLGCYICFFPVEGFGTALQFLVVAGMLLVINVVSIFFQNQKNQVAINVFHICLNVIFTIIITGIAWAERLDAIYLILYVVTSFVFVQILKIRQCRQEKNDLFAVSCIGSGVYIFMLYLIGNLGPGLESAGFKLLYVHMVAEILVLAVSVAAIMFWDKEDGRRWAHAYYPALLMISLLSEYNLEVIITMLLVFFVVKLLTTKHRELLVLDCIVTVWTALIGLAFVGFVEWDLETLDKNPVLNGHLCMVIIMIAMLISVVLIRAEHLYFYSEFVITAYVFLGVLALCDRWEIADGWLLVIEAAVLFLLFLIFNHLPKLKGKTQFPYNLVSVCIMALVYVFACTQDWIITTIMMILGAIVILVVFRKRYQLAIPRKPLLLAGFLSVFALVGDYGSPVITSILLMIIALGCVGVGFKIRDKVERICGLVMAIFVCVKLVLYDFREVESIYRVVVFLVVGILALIISFIYIQLEKNEDRQEKQPKSAEIPESDAVGLK